MRRSPVLDELDYLLVTALQVAPRADWQTIGDVLGLDASTAARRWARLTRAGHAWISVHPRAHAHAPSVVAFIEVDCSAGRLHEVAAEIAGDPHVFNLEHASGGRDLLVTAVFTDQAELARYVGFRLGALDGVAASRTQIATTLHTEGSRWRLDRLTEEQRRRLAPAATAGARPQGGRMLQGRDLELVQALSENPRQPAAQLAERTGLSPTTVRRRLDRLDAEHALVYRCEVARALSGWPVSVSLWAAVPQSQATRLAERISALREIRLCASLSGPYNLLLAAWLRSVDDIASFESQLVERFPELAVSDRALTLWQMKLGGHLLDPQGRHLRPVPLGLWHDPHSEAAEAALLDRLRTPPGLSDR
ncbi:Lrp/AsnC family transcriptional regulator [Streptomyces sp. NPDC050803]|uniref:Lrp/AsnC family transcriptional regulator n=1 Tax=unclassified Streptomyces TaxID=2593676 RepID=UPI003435D547